LDVIEQRNPIHARHPNIRKDGIEGACGELANRRFAGWSPGGFEAAAPNEHLDHLGDRRIVLDDEHAFARGHGDDASTPDGYDGPAMASPLVAMMRGSRDWLSLFAAFGNLFLSLTALRGARRSPLARPVAALCFVLFGWNFATLAHDLAARSGSA